MTHEQRPYAPTPAGDDPACASAATRDRPTDVPAPATPEPNPSSPFHIDRRVLRRWAAGAIVFGVIYGVALLFFRRFNLQGVAEGAAEGAGRWGVLAFLALMAAAVMSPLPDAPVALTGLVAYGPFKGLMLVVAGSWLGAAANFALVRVLGRDAFRSRFPRVVGPMDDLSNRLGFELLVLLRFLPTVSFDVVSYAAAVTTISFPRFAGATLLGQLPGPTIAALVGSGVSEGASLATLALGAFASALLVTFLIVRWTLRARAARARVSLPDR